MPSSSSSDDLRVQVKTHEVALAELGSISSSRPRLPRCAIYEIHGNIYFQTTLEKATSCEQKKLDAVKAELIFISANLCPNF